MVQYAAVLQKLFSQTISAWTPASETSAGQQKAYRYCGPPGTGPLWTPRYWSTVDPQVLVLCGPPGTGPPQTPRYWSTVDPQVLVHSGPPGPQRTPHQLSDGALCLSLCLSLSLSPTSSVRVALYSTLELWVQVGGASAGLLQGSPAHSELLFSHLLGDVSPGVEGVKVRGHDLY